MDSLVNALVHYCIHSQIIPAEKEAWFRYGLEKRIYTVCIFIPCALFAAYISSFYVAVSFFISFQILRTRVNGYHANSLCGCLCGSLVLECLFLCGIYPIIDITGIFLLIISSFFLIWTLAPYNHPEMQLTSEEYNACRKSAHVRICLLTALTLLLLLLGYVNSAKGVSLGCAMTSLLLFIAYISDRRINNEKKPE